jgi:phosphatidylglycerophosphate synthase
MRVEIVTLLVMLAAIAASMVVYGVRGATRDAAHEAKGTHLFLGAGDFLVHWMIWILEPPTSWSIRLGITPDQHSYVATAIGLVSAALFAGGHLSLGGWMLALSGVIDTLDGHLARRTGRSSRRGDFIDGTLDRFVDAAVFLALMFYFRDLRWGPLIAAGALSGSLIVSYARARGEVQGVNCHGGLMQRPERVVTLSVVGVFDPILSPALGYQPGSLVLLGVAIIAVTTFVTAVHRTIWIAARL